jgi:hypothetical protein
VTAVYVVTAEHPTGGMDVVGVGGTVEAAQGLAQQHERNAARHWKREPIPLRWEQRYGGWESSEATNTCYFVLGYEVA